MSATPVQRPVRRMPKPRSEFDEERRGIGCLLPLIVIAVILAALGYFFRETPLVRGILEKIRPRQYADVQIIDPSIGYVEKKPEEKPVVTNVVEAPPPPEPPKKSVRELKAEADEAQLRLSAEIVRARAGGKSLMSFAGLTIGDVMQGTPVATEKLPLSEGETNVCGVCCVMNAPLRETDFAGFGKQPIVYVTPMTHRIFRIEFSKSIAYVPGWPLNAATTGLVARLSQRLKVKPYALDLTKYPLGRREFVFPFGEATLTVGEYGGERLKLTFEHAGLREQARVETEAFRKEALAQTVHAKTLSSDKYPNAGMVKFGRVQMKSGTPRAFCGVVFGSLPPYSARVGKSASSTDASSFFIDYRKSKCRPFMNFEHGKADLSSINGAVVAVHLFSNGPESGLSAAEYHEKVRNALDRKFQVKPSETKGKGPLAELTYVVGSLTVRFGPDAQGGFSLSAENDALKSVW